jgi:predicted DNA-binding protein
MAKIPNRHGKERRQPTVALKTIVIPVPIELHTTLTRLSKVSGRTMTSIVNAALAEVLPDEDTLVSMERVQFESKLKALKEQYGIEE